jgi:SAM-dependent methyltransferase
MDRAKRAYWNARALLYGGMPLASPLRPADEDVAAYLAGVRRACVGLARPPRALLLGATRALATLPWPAGTRFLALDWSALMIKHRWPSHGAPPDTSFVLGDWRQMPLAAGRFDLVIGDACSAALGTFADCARLHEEVWRVLRPGGYLIQRAVLRPEAPEPLDRLFAQLFAGEIDSMGAFRWRLAMALHGTGGEAVRADRVYSVWRAHVPDAAPVLARTGWDARTLALIEGWKGLEVTLPFPSLSEVRDMTRKHFEMLECRVPTSYALAHCCPMLTLRARRA